MKRRMQKILAIVLTAGMAFSGVSAEASGDLVLLHAVADTTSSSGVTGDTVETVREDGKEGGAEEIGKRIQKILDEARSFGTYSDEELEAAKKEVAAIRQVYEELDDAEQEILRDSAGYLEDAEVALDRMIDMHAEYRRTGAVKVDQNENPSSFRFINGAKIDVAVKEAIQETAAVAAAESGEPEATVEALASGELQAAASGYEDTTIVADPGAQVDLEAQGGELITVTDADAENLVGSSGRYMGIDISQWNGKVDFDKIKAAGVKFVIIRLGYGNDETNQDDKRVVRNISECERVGLPWGAYIYSYALNDWEANSEVEHALRLLKGKKPQLPVYIDIEDPSQQYAMSVGDRNVNVDKFASNFCSKLKAAGYKTGLYASLTWFNQYFGNFASQNRGYSNWIAQWADRCTYTGTYDMWQYSATGKVNGIQGSVDMDYYYGSIKFPDAYYEYSKDPDRIPMLRLYNPVNHEHFYTDSVNEWSTLLDRGWVAEGIGWYAPKKSDTPVYRLCNPILGDHHYTTSKYERDTLTEEHGWVYEGIGWYSDDRERVPVYREFNPELTSGSHNYTTGKNEHDYLVSAGWADEQIAWYAVKEG